MKMQLFEINNKGNSFVIFFFYWNDFVEFNEI